MGVFAQKFGLLLWKNYILQKRHKVQTVFEILIPLIFTIILVIIRGIIKSEEFPNDSYFPQFDPRDTYGNAVRIRNSVLYAPNTPEITKVMKAVETKFNEILNNSENDPYQFISYVDEEDLLDNYLDPKFSPPGSADPTKNFTGVLAAVVFQDKDFKENINYAIRFPSRMHSASRSENVFGLQPRWQTELLYDLFQLPRAREQITNKTEDEDEEEETPEEKLQKIHFERGGRPGYWREGFLFLQTLVDTEIARVKAEEAGNSPAIVDEFNVRLNRFPYPNYIDDSFIAALQVQFPLFLMLSFIYPIINIAKSVTHEKERRLKESMKIMGLPNWLHWCAWFIKSFVFLLIAAILLTLFYKIPFFNGGDLGILTYADSLLLFVFFLSYAFSTITLGFLVSTFFSAANSASTASGVLFFLTYFPYFFLRPRYDQLTKGAKMIMSLFSNTGMAFGCQIVTMFEGTGAGVHWSTISQGASPDDNLSMLDVIIMLIVDGFLYFFLAIYIEAVFPGDYGVPLPWYFPFTKWYWSGAPRGGSVGDIVGPPLDSHRQRHSHLFEKEPKGHAGIKIIGLTKIFGKKVAVNNLHLNFYENQVTALLGHNGAGKTTTMSMLTGLFPPTSGTAIVNGFDIRNDTKSVRDSLGLCPQHDVLFDEMTVEEHLRFFYLLKGVDKEFVEAEIDRMLEVLMLENKRHAQSQTLSGGMKRKLSVGIALIGGSKVVLLDEPTSGMDPGARRSTWDLITNEKKGRTIVLSTHFMDEADLLGDRIAIMAEGQAQCCGSSLFLKKKYGGGYHLIIVKKEDCQVAEITKLLQQRIPEVEIDQNIGAELSYSLPDEKSYMFPEMFEEMERRRDELGIASYGCSITQMEEVFMRVGKQVEEDMHRQRAELLGNDKASPVQYSMETLNEGSYEKLNKDVDERNEGFPLLIQQLRAMMVKKCLYAFRNKILLATQTVIPVAFLIIALIMLKTMPNVSAPPQREMDLSQYNLFGTPVTTIECNKNEDANACKYYEQVASVKSSVANTGQVSFEDYILAQSKSNLPRVNFQYIVGLKADGKKLTGFFNNQPFHTPPLALNMISNAILRTVTNGSNITISVSNYPLPYTVKDKVENLAETENEGFTIGFNVSFGMSFLAASFVVFVIKERETKSKHLQYVSGVRFPIFWLAHFIFDSVNFLIPVIALMITLLAFNTKDFRYAEMQGYFLLVLLLYGWSVIPLMYLFSFLFTVPSSGYTRMTFFNFLTGMATILAVSILQIESIGLVHVADALEWVFMFFPNFDVGYSLTLLTLNRQYQSMCPLIKSFGAYNCTLDPEFVCCTKYPKAYLSWESPGIGRHIFFSFLVGLIGIIVLFIIESKIIEKIRYRNEQKKYANEVLVKDPNTLEDADVAAENARIRNTNLTQLFKTENMILQDLTKYYENFLAVDRLCLGVQHGECFGLLGVNGAGKTTTFKMLTGDFPISAGNAYIANKSVKSEIKKVQKSLGYCPQFDALIPELTGRETIRLFARLRGIKEDKTDHLVDVLAANLLFAEHIEKPCGTYSGGNKRKLSTALALIGNPPLIFLDEPTTGMDPVARWHLWNTIINVRESGASVVLTSHSMEECEALCTRLAIMVNGKFRCLGSTQHLKGKFGDGFTLIAQMETSTEEKPRRMTRTSIELGRRHSSLAGKPQLWEQELQPLRNFIERHFQGCQLKEVHPGYVHYHIRDEEGVSWGEIFKKMEEAKSLFRLEAYSVGQTTLEQVFLSFTKAQVNND